MDVLPSWKQPKIGKHYGVTQDLCSGPDAGSWNHISFWLRQLYVLKQVPSLDIEQLQNKHHRAWLSPVGPPRFVRDSKAV